eukprot:scaffold4948_cov144-Skeletonema_menzelii.AAC.3
MTSSMILSFLTLIALAGRSGWSIDGLKRANYSSLYPSLGSPWVAPIFIQLLLYNEVVPLVSSRLGDETKVRRAILFGSSVPLLMCLIWSCVALGIVPYEPTLVATNGGSSIYDPLSRLSQRVNGKGGSIGKAFLSSVNAMAGSAICTTVFGSIFATTQYIDDVITHSFGGRKDTFWRSLCKHSFAIFPSAMIAALGSSELYYHATSFAVALIPTSHLRRGDKGLYSSYSAITAKVIPEKCHVGISVWSLHRSEKHFPEPLEFRPDRWVRYCSTSQQWIERSPQTDSNEGGCSIPAGNKQSFLAFSSGSRSCPGRSFAIEEASLALAVLIDGLEFDIDSSYQPEMEWKVVVQKPKGGIPATISIR